MSTYMSWKIAFSISSCLALAAGCALPPNPYLNCGPVWSRGACQNCNPDYVSGSILNGRASGSLTAEDAARPQPGAVKDVPQGK
jgi:hypothetical protein